ncbi:autotransporter outer membrane beta-barrel domain-containing protein, partial [Acidocella sp. KAb 2-4]|uniref:autotransporter outer membrane beta-barrel domain-containing protein n=1 Tax=Acidocella sp. KAb 2-4 TaxID=2885158 RepID=UPI001D072EF2
GSNLATGAYNLAGGGFLAGVDRAVPATGGRVGLAVGYDAATLRGHADGTTGLETLRLGLYASQPLGAAVLSADVLDGIARLNTTRQTGAGAALAKMDGNVLTVAAQMALPLRWRGVEITPAAGLRVTNVSLGRFAETAAAQAFALRGAAASGMAVTPFLRLDLGRRFVTASQIVITPRVTLGLDTALGTQGAGIGVTTRSGAGLELTPWRQGRVSGLAGLGLSVARGGWSVDFGYSGRFAGNWSAQSVQAAVSARF